MPAPLRKTPKPSLLALGSAVLWGLIELLALNRYRRPGR